MDKNSNSGCQALVSLKTMKSEKEIKEQLEREKQATESVIKGRKEALKWVLEK